MTRGYVLITCELGAEEEIIEQIKKIDGTKDVFGTFGIHDIVAVVEADNLEKLKELISWNIQKIDKIRKTATLVRR